MQDVLIRVLRERAFADRRLGVAAWPVPEHVLMQLVEPPMSPVAAEPGTRPPPRVAAALPRRPGAAPPATRVPDVAPAAAVLVLPQEITPELAGLHTRFATKAEALVALDELHNRTCPVCRLLLTQQATRTVFADGNPDSPLVFVGEAPGETEDAEGLPFVGRAGQLLNRMIEAMGVTRPDVYITNVVKARPPGNRTPVADEVAGCSPYLYEQLRIIRPRVIVTLGNPATQTLLSTKVGITKLRGTWQHLHVPDLDYPIKVMPTYHPAFLLRQGGSERSGFVPQSKKEAWADLQMVMAELGWKRPGK